MDKGRKTDELSGLKIDYQIARQLPLNFVKRYKVVPIRKENGSILVGAVDKKLSPQVIDDLRVFYRTGVKPYYMEEDILLSLIARIYYDEREAATGIIEGMKRDKPSLTIDGDGTKDLLESTEEGPVIAFVNSLLSEAVSKRASDIHIEPFERDIRVRYRIDGVLYNTMSLPKTIHSNISSRIKVMSSLDVAEKRIPQDGKIKVRIGGRDIDIRVSTFPTNFGERIVLRLLNRKDVLLELEDLGFEREELKRFSRLIHMDHGLILVTGPTGAGKTTTLYASLSKINSPEKNILTIEDPIEYQLEGVGQMQVNPKIGLTFARGLRHILRQDPDVIMVGEIRDRETAEIAIHASLTGHLVFSTLHTDDVAGAIARLLDMGVEPYLVASSTIGVLAQRLVRVLCNRCKVPFKPVRGNGRSGTTRTEPHLTPSDDGETLDMESVDMDREADDREGSDTASATPERLFATWCSKVVNRRNGDDDTGLDTFSSRFDLKKGISLYKRGGCEACFNTGYFGRTGIYELLVINDSIRKLIVDRCDSSMIKEMAMRQGMSSLKKNGLRKVLKGVTSIEEIMRVIHVY